MLLICCLSIMFENKIYCGPIWRNVHFPVPLDYRSSFASKIDATYVINAHSVIQFVMRPCHAGKMHLRLSRFSNFLEKAPHPRRMRAFDAHVGGFAPYGAPFRWIGHQPL